MIGNKYRIHYRQTIKETDMKNIFKALMLAVVLNGCYEDKGNYEYTLDSMNDITSVKFTPAIVETASGKVIEVRQAMTEKDMTCRIEAHLEQTLEKNFDNLDFYWYRTYTDDTGAIIQDTVFTRGYLEVTLPIGAKVEQDILLQIYDRTTTLSRYSSFKFMTRPPFKNSLFVLHGEDGNRQLGNIAIIGSDTLAYTDIKTVTNDNNLYNDADGFDYSDTDDGRLSLTIFSESKTTAYEPFEMEVKFRSEDLFKPNTTDFAFNRVVKAGDPMSNQYKVVLSQNGEMYIGNNLPPLYKPGYNEELSGNTLHMTDYHITAATITRDHYFFWDDKNGRMLYSSTEESGMAREEKDVQNPNLVSNKPVLDTNADFSQISPVGKTAIMGYVNYQQGWDAEFKDFYFIFKDQGGSYYRYEFKTGEKNSSEVVCTLEKEKILDNFNPSNTSTIKYSSRFSTNYLFYANGSTVYRYNVANGDNIPVYEAPSGYEVTLVKFRSDEYNKSNYIGDLDRIMSIGLYNEAESKGAIAEIRFTTSADVDKDFVQLFYDKDDEGKNWGRIKDLQFARVHQYDLADYQKEEVQ